jgi:transglutaminase-like putative cysteine protease
VNDGYSLAVVTPRRTPLQRVEYVDIVVEPEPDERLRRHDAFGNHVLQVGIHRQHDTLTVAATSEVALRPRALEDAGPAWEDVAAAVTELRGPAALAVRPFAGGVSFVGEPGDQDALADLAASVFQRGRPVIEAVRALCSVVDDQFQYDPSFTEVSTPLATVLAARRGVCQDFAHLAVGALRTVGLAARYVSGYIESSIDQSAGADAPTHPTPGARCGCRRSAGSTSIRRTGSCPPTTTSPLPGGATTAT